MPHYKENQIKNKVGVIRCLAARHFLHENAQTSVLASQFGAEIPIRQTEEFQLLPSILPYFLTVVPHFTLLKFDLRQRNCLSEKDI